MINGSLDVYDNMEFADENLSKLLFQNTTFLFMNHYRQVCLDNEHQSRGSLVECMCTLCMYVYSFDISIKHTNLCMIYFSHPAL